PGDADPRLFEFACQELGVNPAQTLMVGDSTWDMMMGSQGGAAGCIGISWGRSMQPIGMADLTIEQLSQLQISQ
ncbi:HAD family hydrolase, partial [Chamaesiphon sp. OTE_20_metabat_361]|uniref:HAD family hydrolase n=1 Tax=Chamaesiphon sp. OTE_20_metabat_361 TaxID=2964689 RepID=UPI00286AE85E